jgi:3-methyladenine DNA glycosylase AlkC
MGTSYNITEQIGKDLALLLSGKILSVWKEFNKKRFVSNIERMCKGKTYTQRIELFADELRSHLPDKYETSLAILLSILGEENPNETGMFSNYYWLMPVGKFVEKYGLDHYDLSIHAIGEITKRNTGEYAIRPYIRKYPRKTLRQMKRWAKSDNFHLRRLASEGLRPKLPWAAKLDTFIDNPGPVFEVLEILKEDRVKFVKKSVANHLTDWLKVNPIETVPLIRRWRKSENKHTQWIVKHATC